MFDREELLKEVELNLRRILGSTRGWLTTRKLHGKFVTLTGQNLPFGELGHESMLDFLKSIPNTVDIKFSPSHSTVYVKAAHTSQSAADDSWEESLTETTVSDPETSEACNSSHSLQRSVSSTRRVAKGRSVYLPLARRFESFPPVVQESVLATLKEKTHQVIAQHPGGISFPDFLAAYKRQFSKGFDFQEFGFGSLKECLERIQDLEVTTKHRQQLVFLAATTSSEHPTDDISEIWLNDEDLNMIENVEAIIRNSRTLLRTHPEGILLDDFLHIYLLNFEEGFVPKNLGFSNMESLLLAIADDVPLKFVESGDETIKVYFRLDASLHSSGYPSLTSSGAIPDDALLAGRQYSKQELLTLSDNEFFPVYASEVQSPGEIWIQLKGDGTATALSDLSARLNQFYNSPKGSSYVMKNEHIVKETVCACAWTDGNWYRTIVTNATPKSSSVDILYVDYGTKQKVQKSNLRYLRQEFLALSAQGIKARLAFLQPVFSVGDTWDKRAFSRLLDVVAEKTLMARVCYNTMHPNILTLWLCDCSGGRQVYLSKLLVDEGLAMYNQEEIQNTPSVPCCDSGSFQYSTGLSRLVGPHQGLLNQTAFPGPSAPQNGFPSNFLNVIKKFNDLSVLCSDINVLLNGTS